MVVTLCEVIIKDSEVQPVDLGNSLDLDLGHDILVDLDKREESLGLYWDNGRFGRGSIQSCRNGITWPGAVIDFRNNVEQIVFCDRLWFEMGVFGSNQRVLGDVLVHGIALDYLTDLREPLEPVCDFVWDGGEAGNNADIAEMTQGWGERNL